MYAMKAFAEKMEQNTEFLEWLPAIAMVPLLLIRLFKLKGLRKINKVNGVENKEISAQVDEVILIYKFTNIVCINTSTYTQTAKHTYI